MLAPNTQPEGTFNKMAKAKKLPSGSWRALAYSHSEPEFDEAGNPVLGEEGNKNKREPMNLSQATIQHLKGRKMLSSRQLNSCSTKGR